MIIFIHLLENVPFLFFISGFYASKQSWGEKRAFLKLISLLVIAIVILKLINTHHT